jgi:hypothetical protein
MFNVNVETFSEGIFFILGWAVGQLVQRVLSSAGGVPVQHIHGRADQRLLHTGESALLSISSQSLCYETKQNQIFVYQSDFFSPSRCTSVFYLYQASPCVIKLNKIRFSFIKSDFFSPSRCTSVFYLYQASPCVMKLNKIRVLFFTSDFFSPSRCTSVYV